MKQSSLRLRPRPQPAAFAGALAAALTLIGAAGEAQAQTYPVTPQQRATAQQAAAQGVPLSELAPNAPAFVFLEKSPSVKLFTEKA